MNSDKENESPVARETTPRRAKGRALRAASTRMPTPDSGSTDGNGSKRRRTDDYSMADSRIYDDQADQEDEEEGVDTPSQSRLQADQVEDEDEGEDEEEGDLRFYNPNQDPEKRRRLRATMRDHQRMLDGRFSSMSLAM